MRSGLKRFQKAEALHFVTVIAVVRVPARKPVARRGALKEGLTSVLFHSFRRERGKHGRSKVKDRHGMNSWMSPPPAHGKERDE